jgi:hypothetical protein
MNKVEFLESLIDEVEELDTVAQVKELIQNKIDEAIQFSETKDIYDLNLGNGNGEYDEPTIDLDLDVEDDTY